MGEKTVYEKSMEKYQELFPDDSTKAASFDKLAQMYYMCNFGSALKSDVDLLMFSEYIDRILDKDEADMSQYSDYTMSKLLGIPQSRISSLKEKKELKYPYGGFEWRRSFERIAKNVRYENGNVVFNIPDRNLYLEIKNAIEENNGYVEVQLNPHLMKVPVEYFLDFMIIVEGDNEDVKKEVEKKLRDELRKRNKEIDFIESDSFGTILKKVGIREIISILDDISNVVNFTPLVKGIIKTVTSVISYALDIQARENPA